MFKKIRNKTNKKMKVRSEALGSKQKNINNKNEYNVLMRDPSEKESEREREGVDANLAI